MAMKIIADHDVGAVHEVEPSNVLVLGFAHFVLWKVQPICRVCPTHH